METPVELARSLLAFIDAAPTPFHAVAQAAKTLAEAGFAELAEGEPWALEPGDRRYVIRSDASIVAFVVGSGPPQEHGFLVIGAHTDSPCLRVKPCADLRRHGTIQVAVEPYGGLLFTPWMDRDLGLSGRVILGGEGGVLRRELVHVRRPVARIPHLAIHLDREVNTKGQVLNAQQHLVPVLGLDRTEPPAHGWLKELICRELRAGGVRAEPGEILEYDLMFHDVQPSALGGMDEELIFAPRLDNLASCHSALHALARAAAARPMVEATRVVAFWDHEECGSRSMQGAQGPLLNQVLERVVQAGGGTGVEASARAFSRSFLISADMAHAVHPNYADRHDPNHAPVLGAGPVIKTNANQSYATDAWSAAKFAALCEAEGFTPQRFVTRSDLACGSTIGPLTAARAGLHAVDVGSPMLSMHSVREMAAVEDHAKMTAVMRRYMEAGRAEHVGACRAITFEKTILGHS